METMLIETVTKADSDSQITRERRCFELPESFAFAAELTISKKCRRGEAGGSTGKYLVTWGTRTDNLWNQKHSATFATEAQALEFADAKTVVIRNWLRGKAAA